MHMFLANLEPPYVAGVPSLSFSVLNYSQALASFTGERLYFVKIKAVLEKWLFFGLKGTKCKSSLIFVKEKGLGGGDRVQRFTY